MTINLAQSLEDEIKSKREADELYLFVVDRDNITKFDVKKSEEWNLTKAVFGFGRNFSTSQGLPLSIQTFAAEASYALQFDLASGVEICSSELANEFINSFLKYFDLSSLKVWAGQKGDLLSEQEGKLEKSEQWSMTTLFSFVPSTLSINFWLSDGKHIGIFSVGDED